LGSQDIKKHLIYVSEFDIKSWAELLKLNFKPKKINAEQMRIIFGKIEKSNIKIFKNAIDVVSMESSLNLEFDEKR
jgi:hypothetical protein